jgi:CelD/BcsL family acetyltransferase involved in cellulose biosynthesis
MSVPIRKTISAPITEELPLMSSGSPAKSAKELSCEIVTDLSRLEALGSEWERLWTSSAHMYVFQTFGWMKAFWRVHGRELELRTALVWRGSELAGVLPLVLRGAVLEFMGSQYSDYNDVICGEECAADVVRTAFEALVAMPGWRTCKLNNVLSESRLVRNLAALPPGVHAQTAFSCPCPAIVAGEDGSYSDLLRNRHLRKDENKLQKQGEVTFRHAESRDDVFEHLDDFFEQHIARRAMLGQRSSFFLSGSARDFFRALVQELDPAAVLRFGILALNGRPVAYFFCFETNQKLFGYLSAFDIDLFSYRPGQVLWRKMFAYAQERRLVEIDLMNGGEEYKQRLANTVRQNLTVYIDRNGISAWSSAVGRAARIALHRSQEELRRYPAVYTRLRWLARRLRQESARLQSLGVAAYLGDVPSRLAPSFTVSKFSIARESLSGETFTHPDGTTIEPLSLRAMARLSTDYPELLSQLENTLTGLASGEKFYLLRQCSKPTQIWSVMPLSTEAAVMPAAPTLIVRECWSTRSPTNGSCGIVPHLVDLSPEYTRQVLVFCRRSSDTAKQLKSVGFRPARRKMPPLDNVVLGLVRRALNLCADLRFGTSLRGNVSTRFGHMGAFSTANTDYLALCRMFDGEKIQPDDVLVDVGCGKGRVVNFWLSRYPHNRMIGLELDPQIAAQTEKRLSKFKNVTIVAGDCLKRLPPAGTIFYLYNPFDEAVMREFKKRLLALPQPDRIRIFYYNCKFAEIFAGDPRFEVKRHEIDPRGRFLPLLVIRPRACLCKSA